MKTTAANLLNMVDVAFHFDEPLVIPQHRDPWQSVWEEGDRLNGVIERRRSPNGDTLIIYADGSHHFHDHRVRM